MLKIYCDSQFVSFEGTSPNLERYTDTEIYSAGIWFLH